LTEILHHYHTSFSYTYFCQKSALEQPLNQYETGQLFLIDKPIDWTSFDAVRKIRNTIKIKKVGHAGTLDPLATGLLIICTGKFTKQINEYMGMEKEYTGTITLGHTTATYDRESEPENAKDIAHLTHEQLQTATLPFIGDILQKPPMFSAIKKNGERLYELARRGEAIELEDRPVTISVFELTKIELPHVHFKVVCSTGTYIRSLANDFGAALGVGGYLSSLRRTRIGKFIVEDAITVDQAVTQIKTTLGKT
jgi:tRNA pseudouridine55 synthase